MLELATKIRTGELLVRRKKLTQKQLDECLDLQERERGDGVRRLIGQIAIDRGFVSSEDVEEVLSGINPYFGKNDRRTNDFFRPFSQKVISKITRERFNAAYDKQQEMSSGTQEDIHLINALHSIGDLSYEESYKLLVEVVKDAGVKNIRIDYDPANLVVENGEVYLGINNGREKVRPVFMPESSSETQILMPYDKWQVLDLKTEIQKTGEFGNNNIRDFRDVVSLAMKCRASDIHILPKHDCYRIYFTVDGRFTEAPDLIMSTVQGKALTKLIMIEAGDLTKGSYNPEETKKSQPAKMEYKDLCVGLRLEFAPDGITFEHIDTTARIIPSYTDEKISRDLSTNLKRIGYLEEDIAAFKHVMHRKNGLILFGGVVGSGKSTTICNILPTLGSDIKIVTVEDPVEYALSKYNNILQHQIYEPDNPKLQMGFEEYITSFKRGACNVVFVGEWRKTEGLTKAIIEQANAGQLLFSTIHTTSSFEIYSALYELFEVPIHTSARMILMSVNQSLIPKLCSKCKKPTNINFVQDDLKYLSLSKIERETLLEFNIDGFSRNEKGCPHCNNGIHDRTVVYDYFIPTQDFIRDVIKNNRGPLEIKQDMVSSGMGRSKISVFLERLKEGVVAKSSLEEI